jgi:hypothetical protein
MAQKNLQQDAKEAARRLEEETGSGACIGDIRTSIPNALESW